MKVEGERDKLKDLVEITRERMMLHGETIY